MKLRRAHIKNFRLLKDLELNFSTSEKQPLTVIRAANETGKTTCERALTWGLYGKDALPGKDRGKSFSLAPADMQDQSNSSVEISVEIEFETKEVVNPGKPNQFFDDKVFRLVRSVKETLPKEGGSFNRQSEIVLLFEVDDSGVKPIKEKHRIEEIIQDAIPVELKDIYFTDGDAAMSFIEANATAGVKRKRVGDAIESLLGLKSLEDAIRHTNAAANKFSSQIDNTDYAGQLKTLNDKVSFHEEDLTEAEEGFAEEQKTLKEANENIRKLEQQIDEIVKLGDRAALVTEKSDATRNKEKADNLAKSSLERLAKILSSEALANSVISEAALSGLSILNEMSDRKELPKANVPILEELLTKPKCFCGASLKESDSDGKTRRKHISDAIEASLEADALSEAATSLYYSVRSKSFGQNPAEEWLGIFADAQNNYANAQVKSKEFQSEIKRIGKAIDELKDNNLKELRELRDHWSEAKGKAQMSMGSLETKIENAKQVIKEGEEDRLKLENKLNRSGVSTAKLNTARKAEHIFKSIFARMKRDEVALVSKEMNRIFLGMIGANKDPDTNDLTLISKAELTQDFDIVVYGPNGHQLNPDDDLNGASRRAITLAFILALTRVSQVEAPNVIDTPLGMMAGYVKQSVLLQAVNEGSQTIMFLTHDEIKGVEPILDKYAGVVYTLTNPAHFPNMLINKPNVEDIRILRCECSHNESCEICERKFVELH